MFYMLDMSDRRQINFRDSEDGEVRRAIEDIRRVMSPIPSSSEVLRDAVFEYRDKVLRKVDAQQKVKRK